MKKACLVDLDGTLSNCEWRLPLVRTPGVKKEWGKFFRGIPNDTVIEHTRDYVKLHPNLLVIYFTARPANTEAWTRDWLNKNNLMSANSHSETPLLFMRDEKDFRPDTIVKEEMLKKHIINKFDIAFAIDDKQSIIEMFRRYDIQTYHPDELKIEN